MNEALHDQIIRRLVDSKLDDIALELVDAACEGQDAFDEAIADLGGRPPPARPREGEAGSEVEPRSRRPASRWWGGAVSVAATRISRSRTASSPRRA